MCCTFNGSDGKDVYPDGKYDVTSASGVSAMRWGFLSGKRKIINARAETLTYKFDGAFKNGRGIVKARGFYEWSANKQKFYYTNNSGEILLCALCRRDIDGNGTRFVQLDFWGGEQEADDGEPYRFVVITTAANMSVSPVHSRMPLIVSADRADDWLHDGTFARKLLSSEMPMLNAFQCDS